MRFLKHLLVLAVTACGPKDAPIDTDNTSTDTTNSTGSAGSATVVMTAGECNSGTVGCTDDSLTDECADSSATCTFPPTSEDPSITGCIVHTVGCTSIDPTTAAPATDVTATDTDTDTGTGTETDTDAETFNPCAVETAGCTGFGTTGTESGTSGTTGTGTG